MYSCSGRKHKGVVKFITFAFHVLSITIFCLNPKHLDVSRIQAAQAAVESCFSTEKGCDFSSTLMSTFISFVSHLPGITDRLSKLSKVRKQSR